METPPLSNRAPPEGPPRRARRCRLTGARTGDAVHSPLHIGLVLSVTQDQALLPACQSPAGQRVTVHVLSPGSPLEDAEAANPHAACRKRGTPTQAGAHTLKASAV